MNALLSNPSPLPLTEDASGVIRIGGTRVTLDTLVAAFDEGATAEEIVQQYPSLGLADVYAVVSHCLQNRPAVDAYLAGREAQVRSSEGANPLRIDGRALRERLLARRGT